MKGGVIASTQRAVDNNQNSFTTGGTLTTRDLQNTASFNGRAAGLSVDAGQQAGKFGVSGVGVGLGSDKGSAASTTTSGISGIAGNTAVRSTDAQTGLTPLFDAAKVQREIDAQVAITQAFSNEAPKAVAKFAASQIDDLKTQANAEVDPAKTQALLDEADKWVEGGKYRVLLHTLAGAFSGGASGAAGAAASAGSAPLMNQLQDSLANGLQAAGLGADGAKAIAQGLAGLTAAGVGAAVGGAQGAATAATVDANNRQLHPTERTLASELAANSKGKYSVEQIEAAMRLSGIKGSSITPDSIAVITKPGNSDPSAPGARFDNGMPLLRGTGVVLVEQSTPASPDLIAFVQQATGGANSPYYWSAQTSNPATTSNTPADAGGPRYYSCATTDCLLTGANRNPNNLLNQAEAQRAQNAMGAAGLIVGIPLAIVAAPSAALGFGLGSGFDAAGQYAQSGTVRPAQSLVAGVTGAVALPLAAGRTAITSAVIGAGTAGLNTTFNNAYYDEFTSTLEAMRLGGIFGGVGTFVGAGISNFLRFTPKIPLAGATPTFSVAPRIGAPYASPIGNTVSNTTGGIPSFIPLDPNVGGVKK